MAILAGLSGTNTQDRRKERQGNLCAGWLSRCTEYHVSLMSAAYADQAQSLCYLVNYCTVYFTFSLHPLTNLFLGSQPEMGYVT